LGRRRGEERHEGGQDEVRRLIIFQSPLPFLICHYYSVFRSREEERESSELMMMGERLVILPRLGKKE
jgi:hypothetical protein